MEISSATSLSNSFNDQSWANWKPGASIFLWVSHVSAGAQGLEGHYQEAGLEAELPEPKLRPIWAVSTQKEARPSTSPASAPRPGGCQWLNGSGAVDNEEKHMG